MDMSNTATTCHTESCKNISESYSILCWDCAMIRARKMHAGSAARRDASTGEIVAVGVRLPAMFYAIDDLRSDAQHYADGDDYEGGMRSAARSMLAALDRNTL